MSTPNAPHQIDTETAVGMTTLYRQNRMDNYPICESFQKVSVEALLATPDCAYLRIYYGMKEDMTVHAILVAADKNGNDILPYGVGGDGGEILEDSIRCPQNCPPDSPLNVGL